MKSAYVELDWKTWFGLNDFFS